MKQFTRTSLAVAVTLGAITATSAAAADDEQVQTLYLDSIVVTGEKIERTAERTLSSVAVVTADDLRDHGDVDLQSVFERTPGVYAQSGNENWGIRGIPVTGFDDRTLLKRETVMLWPRLADGDERRRLGVCGRRPSSKPAADT